MAMATREQHQNGTPANRQPDTSLALKETANSDRGLILRNYPEMLAFAEMVAKSGLAPKGLATPPAILVALQMGAELGLTPMAALQNIAVINGRPSVWGDAQLAICRGSGRFCEETFFEEVKGDGDARTATCTVRRLPNGKVVTSSFSVADAKRANLWNKEGPWRQYPDRMLKMRARSYALRDAFTDTLRGFPSADEMQDVIDVDSRPSTNPSQAPSNLADLKRQMNETLERMPSPEDIERAAAQSEREWREEKKYQQPETSGDATTETPDEQPPSDTQQEREPGDDDPFEETTQDESQRDQWDEIRDELRGLNLRQAVNDYYRRKQAGMDGDDKSRLAKLCGDRAAEIDKEAAAKKSGSAKPLPGMD